MPIPPLYIESRLPGSCVSQISTWRGTVSQNELYPEPHPHLIYLDEEMWDFGGDDI